jgi:Fic family protein
LEGDKMKFNSHLPYNNLPTLPPKIDIETKPILKKAINANKALAGLKGVCSTIPNPLIVVNAIILQEAKDSSQIENIVTTNDQLYEAFTETINTYDAHTKEVLRYREALWEGFNRLNKNNLLTTNLFINVYNVIKATSAGIRRTPGTKIATSTGKTLYTPPEGENIIRDKLRNLEEFIHNDKDDIDPLIKLALIHYQFEAIHPFTDGNGRTGRIINILYLTLNGLLELPVLYLSKYIIENKELYYQLLRNVSTKNAWEPWIEYVLDGIETTAIYTEEKIIKIRKLLDDTIEKAKIELPKRVYSKELIELLFVQPYCKVKQLVDAGIAKRQTAAEYLKELEKIRILKSRKVGTTKLYLNIKLYELLS